MTRAEPVAPSRLRIAGTRAAIPASPPPATYVVVDVLYFSTTVVELLAGGADCVHVPLAGSDPAAFRRVNPGALVGGEGTGSAPHSHHDFFNSPSDVASLDAEGKPASMTSYNGGRTVAALRAVDGCDVYVASTTNAGAAGHHLRTVDGPITLVAAGCEGERAPEDLLGARLVARYAAGYPVDDALRAAVADRVLDVRPPAEQPEHRQRDLAFATDVDSRAVVPRLDGDRLVDAGRAVDPRPDRIATRS